MSSSEERSVWPGLVRTRIAGVLGAYRVNRRERCCDIGMLLHAWVGRQHAGQVERANRVWTGVAGGRDQRLGDRPLGRTQHQGNGFPAAPMFVGAAVRVGQALAENAGQVAEHLGMALIQRGKRLLRQLQHLGGHDRHGARGSGPAGDERHFPDDVAMAQTRQGRGAFGVLEKHLQQTVLNHEKAGSMLALHEEQFVGLQMTHTQLQRNLRQCVGA